jgi:hypothetical protein
MAQYAHLVMCKLLELARSSYARATFLGADLIPYHHVAFPFKP